MDLAEKNQGEGDSCQRRRRAPDCEKHEELEQCRAAQEV